MTGLSSCSEGVADPPSRPSEPEFSFSTWYLLAGLLRWVSERIMDIHPSRIFWVTWWRLVLWVLVLWVPETSVLGRGQGHEQSA